MPKNIRINSIHHFIIKIPYKEEIQQIASSNSGKNVMQSNIFLVIDAIDAVASDNPLHIRKNLVERM